MPNFFSGTATTMIGLTYEIDRYLDCTIYYRMLATDFLRVARFCGVTRRSLGSQGRYHFILDTRVTVWLLQMLCSTDRPGHKDLYCKFDLDIVVVRADEDSSHRKKREQKSKQNAKLGKPQDDEFDLFVNSAEIRYT